MKVLLSSDMDSRFFNKEGTITVKVSQRANNKLVLTDDGLDVNIDSTRIYHLSTQNLTQETTGGTEQRRRLTVFPDKLGVFNLDFTPTTTNRAVLFTLPSDAPTPRVQIAYQTHYGGLLWIEANSRDVMGSGLQLNQRVIATLIGVFN